MTIRAPLFALGLLALFLAAAGALAAEESSALKGQPPLTQADIDAYLYFAPRLAGPQGRDPESAAKVIAQAGLTRRRAVYVTAKIAVTQAMALGALSPNQLLERGIDEALRPSTEELTLITVNRSSLEQVQAAARQAARPDAGSKDRGTP